jgi:hypothetical protein
VLSCIFRYRNLKTTNYSFINKKNTIVIYAQFKTLSTGYPSFTDKHKKPIDLLGSGGVMRLDARKSRASHVVEVIEMIQKHANKSSVIGFEILKSPDWRYSNGKVIYSYVLGNNFKNNDKMLG